MKNIKHYLLLLVTQCVLLCGSYVNAELLATTYYHNDATGSPIAATSETGAVKWRENYHPYGDRINNAAAASDNARWYTGHVHDQSTGLTYAGARYYDPVVGRFMAVDPVNFSEGNAQSFNRYAYGNNNPYRFVDPDGNIPVDTIWDIGNIIYDIATGDKVALAADTAALFIPYVPAGITKITKLDDAADVAKGAKELKPTLIQENPRNLIPTQTKSEMSGSKVKRLTKDMKQNGYDQSKPVDAWRNPDTGRLEIQNGHHRTEAAMKAGLDKVPVQVWE